MVKNLNKNYFEQESGRSMVEMLGVLAIIGVLSVGGISGYTTAMNKHKANEILNAAAVRAMAVSTQLQNGVETPTLDEFTENKVGDATFTGVSTAGDKFTIGFNMENNAVLDQMKNIAGTDGIVRKITDGGLTYNDDLSTEVRASDFDGDGAKNGDNCEAAGYTWCSDLNQCIADGTCGTCANTYTGSTTTSAGGTKIGSTNCYCPSGTELNNGKCESSVTKFTILGSNLTHPEAYNLCKANHMELASVQDVLDAMSGCTYKSGNYYEGCDISQLQYTDDSVGKLGEGSVYVVWLNECWSSGGSATGDDCPASYYKGEDKNNDMDPDIDSGSAWGVYDSGYVSGDDRYGNFIYSALCK